MLCHTSRPPSASHSSKGVISPKLVSTKPAASASPIGACVFENVHPENTWENGLEERRMSRSEATTLRLAGFLKGEHRGETHHDMHHATKKGMEEETARIRKYS